MSMQAQAPKRTVFFTVLLVLVTLFQVWGVFIVLMAWLNRINHGQDAGLQLAFLPLTLVALVSLIGLWLWQRWAVFLFGLVALVGFVSDAALGVSPVALLIRVVLLAALFWQIWEHRAAFQFPTVERSPGEVNE